jgi:uncharacterized membrane protein (DUF485 family)
MDQPKDQRASILEEVEEYVKTSTELFKLQFTDRVSDFITSLIVKLIFLLFGFMFVLLLSFALAIWLGDLLGKPYLGFLVAAGVFALIVLLVYVFREGMIQKPVMQSILSKILRK